MKLFKNVKKWDENVKHETAFDFRKLYSSLHLFVVEHFHFYISLKIRFSKDFGFYLIWVILRECFTWKSTNFFLQIAYCIA